MNMSQTEQELIKSFAYGATPQSISAVGRMTADDAEGFRKAHAEEIEAVRKRLAEEGWNDGI